MAAPLRGCSLQADRVTTLRTGGRKPPTFLTGDGERVSITLEPLGTALLVKLETHGFSCTLPASAFVLERIAHKLKGQVRA